MWRTCKVILKKYKITNERWIINDEWFWIFVTSQTIVFLQ
jgi:hypothetical protein